MSTRADAAPRSLVAAVLVMTVVVLGLGGAVVAMKLRPSSTPTTAIERNIEQWKQAVIMDPKSDAARVNLGMAYLDASRTDEARQAFEEALDLNAKNWAALLQLGLLARASEPDRALELLTSAGKNAPAGNKAVPYVAKGDLLMTQGDAASAADAYRRAIADAPFVIEGHLGLARALEAVGDTKGALAEYRQAAKFDPFDKEISDAIARLRGKTDE